MRLADADEARPTDMFDASTVRSKEIIRLESSSSENSVLQMKSVRTRRMEEKMEREDVPACLVGLGKLRGRGAVWALAAKQEKSAAKGEPKPQTTLLGNMLLNRMGV